MSNTEPEHTHTAAGSCCGGHQHAQQPKPTPGACCGGHSHKHDHEKHSHGKLKDPVCGMSVDPATAKHHTRHEEEDYYFCSAGCRTKFEATPQKYLEPAEQRAAEPVPEGTIYTCPMHAEVRQEGPGACPICGMALEPEMVSLDDAPNPELATRFIEFVLSMEGQRLWAFKAGAPGGPVRTSLRRLPVRQDYFTPENLAHATDPGILPYAAGTALTYDPALTGSSFTAIRLVIRAMCLDTHEELKTAWAALIENNFPPQATAAFSDLSFISYPNVTGSIAEKLNQRNMLVTSELSRTLAQQFRQQYEHATNLARQGK